VRLSDVIEELVEERGLDRSILSSIMCEGMLAAYAKRYPDLIFQVTYDKKTDEIVVMVEKTVVAQPFDEDVEIGVRKAKHIDKNLEIGSKVFVPFDGPIGRIEILRAKQVIASKIRNVEATAIYNEFKDKQGIIVHGVIHKCERGGIVVKLQDTMAFLPKSLLNPGDKCLVGYPIRALLKEVLLEPRNENQLILDRISPEFLAQLFALEIPEIYEKLVDIKKIVRSPGYKSKVAVVSNDKNIDPVGTCIGVGGVRIKPILKELGTEKVDVIAWGGSPEVLVKDALKPAEINRVEMVDDKTANVWLNDDQRSLAIGKMGQNISLASRLTDINIHLMPSEGIQEDDNDQSTSEQDGEYQEEIQEYEE
jgi:N utilization substance protein A